MNFAIVTACGRCVRDPQERSNGAVAISLAVNRAFKRQDSHAYDERTTYIDCVAFGGLAKRVARLKRGDLTTIQGRLELGDDWTGQDGEKRRGKLSLVITECEAVSLYRKLEDDLAPAVESEPAETAPTKPRRTRRKTRA
jgi:single-stranded DNA-binding protein